MSIRSCSACGHENTHGGPSCDVCGASLPKDSSSSGVPTRPAERNVRRGTKDRPKSARPAGVAKRRWEPWQLVAGGILGAVVIFFLYGELTRYSSSSVSSPGGQPSVAATAAHEEIQRLEESIQKNPSDAASALRLANLLHDNGLRDPHDLVHAIETYRKYLALQPGNPDARVDMGICYFELARTDSMHARDLYQHAAREMEAAFAEHPTHQAAAFNLGVVKLNAGSLEESKAWFQKTIAIDARSALGMRAKELLDQHSSAIPK